jgi:hypothetical protein
VFISLNHYVIPHLINDIILNNHPNGFLWNVLFAKIEPSYHTFIRWCFVFVELGFVVVYVYVMVEDKIVVIECINDIDDELACDVNMNPTLNNLNVGSIHLQCDDHLLENDEFHLVIIETQIKKWKTLNMKGGYLLSMTTCLLIL